MKGPIQSVEVSYLVHATEDAQKIGSAVESIFGPLGEPKVDAMEGHFGNAITRVNHHVTGEDAARAFASLTSKMGSGLKQRLRSEVGDHLDEHSAFYLRLDKQRLIEGALELAEADPVRLRVKPRLYMARGGAASLFAGLLS
ncbi:MAG TPA: RNA-binding domain-containing protein [Nitrososphaerales archaeon]|nr:RNA-binding domain-containing protein [Nitrososphaerales archaeon]